MRRDAPTRLDVINEKQPDGSFKVVAYGLEQGPIVIEDLAAIAKACKEKDLATTLYLWMLIPLVKGAPAFPIAIDANANAFSAHAILNVHNRFRELFKNNELRVLGSVTDGDPRLRALANMLHAHAGAPASKYLSAPHGLIQLRVPYLDSYGYWLQSQDWLHVAWRIRLIYLVRDLQLGPVKLGPANLNALMSVGSNLGLRAQVIRSAPVSTTRALRPPHARHRI